MYYVKHLHELYQKRTHGLFQLKKFDPTMTFPWFTECRSHFICTLFINRVKKLRRVNHRKLTLHWQLRRITALFNEATDKKYVYIYVQRNVLRAFKCTKDKERVAWQISIDDLRGRVAWFSWCHLDSVGRVNYMYRQLNFLYCRPMWVFLVQCRY